LRDFTTPKQSSARLARVTAVAIASISINPQPWVGKKAEKRLEGEFTLQRVASLSPRGGEGPPSIVAFTHIHFLRS
jgi:hypothetical protein